MAATTERRTIVRAILALASLAGFAGLILIARRAADAVPTSDTAVIESFTLLATQGRLLLGPYSRFQWHHPGPMAFYWMAPFYALSGDKTSGLHAGALVLNLVCLFALTRILARRAGRALMIAVTVSLTVYLWRSSEMLASPWNPHMPVVPMTLLVAATADVLSGAAGTLPLVAALASFTGQTHVGLLPLALMLGMLALAGAMLNRPSDPDAGRLWTRSIWLTLVTLLVCWLPPIVEQATNSPGNLTLIFDFFVRQSHPGQSFTNAFSAWGDMLSGATRPDFYTAHGWKFVESPAKWAEAGALIELAGLVAFGVWSARRADRFGAMLSAVLLAASVLALWSASRIEGAIYDHEIFWMSALGALNVAVLATVAVELAYGFAKGIPTTSRRLATQLLCFLIAIPAYRGTAELRHVVRVSEHPPGESRIARAVSTDLETYIRANRLERPLIRIDQDTWGIAAGAILRLQKGDIGLAVEDDWLPMFTPVFRRGGTESVALTIAGTAAHVRLRDDPESPVVISKDPIYVHRSAVTIPPAP